MSNNESTDEMYQRIEEEIPPLIDEFLDLVKQKEYKKALDIYEKHKGDIIIHLANSTQIYQFHEIIRSLYDEIYNENEATQKRIELLEFDEFYTSAVVELSENNRIPEHYTELTYILFNGYIYTKDWDKAQEICNKMINFAIKLRGKESNFYAETIFQQARLYKEMGNKEKALSNMQEVMKILEKLNMKGTKDWQDCADMIKEIKNM